MLIGNLAKSYAGAPEENPGAATDYCQYSWSCFGLL